MLAVGMVALWFCVAAVPMSLCFARCRLQLLRSAGVEGAALEQETDDDWSLAFEDVLILYADSLKSPAKGKPRDPFRTLVEEVFSQLDTVRLTQSDRIRFSLQFVLFNCDACLPASLGCTALQDNSGSISLEEFVYAMKTQTDPQYMLSEREYVG